MRNRIADHGEIRDRGILPTKDVHHRRFLRKAYNLWPPKFQIAAMAAAGTFARITRGPCVMCNIAVKLATTAFWIRYPMTAITRKRRNSVSLSSGPRVSKVERRFPKKLFRM